MSYYHDPKNVESYLKMAEGYDGQLLIDALRAYLPDGATVLELGMGGGTDFELLNEHYTTTGSDYSPEFVNRYQLLHPAADVIDLDAITLDIDRTFDAIYSNKVLYHLTPEQLQASITRQADILHAGGVALHSFWHGDSAEDMHGLHFEYYTCERLATLIDARFDIIACPRYTEMDADDSLYVILKKK